MKIEDEDKPNAAATDLWRQMFDRAASDAYAATIDPGHDNVEDEARARRRFAEAGWSGAGIEELLANHRARQADAPVTSPGVAAHVELRHGMLCDTVEAAMDRLGLATHAKVARGVEPRTGPFAAKTGVIMTDQSIVTVGAFLFRFCGLVAKAYSRTLRLNPWLWESPLYTPDEGVELLRASPLLLLYWHRIHFSFAMSGTHIGVPFLPATPNEIWLVEQVAQAMEIFALAHEYGHHHFAHGRDMNDEARRQEFEADQFALQIGREIDRTSGPIENPYVTSGAGGVILLRALETQRAIEARLGRPLPTSNTHPPTGERIGRFDSTMLLFPDEFRRLKGFRTAADRVMTLVGDMLQEGLSDLPPDAIRDAVRLREQMRGE